MTHARNHRPDTALLWYPAYDIPCVVCGYAVNRFFYYTHAGIYQVWAEHRTFGFRRDCLIQKAYVQHD